MDLPVNGEVRHISQVDWWQVGMGTEGVKWCKKRVLGEMTGIGEGAFYRIDRNLVQLKLPGIYKGDPIEDC